MLFKIKVHYLIDIIQIKQCSNFKANGNSVCWTSFFFLMNLGGVLEISISFSMWLKPYLELESLEM